MALSAGPSRSTPLTPLAHMYPEGGPAEDCESSAERKLYYRFRETLGPDFYVIHSAKWNTLASNGRMQPGEADFIVIHPALGIAILEVKGGRITQEPKSGRWYTIDRDDKKSQIRDPFTQAMKSAKVLERKLRTVPATRPFAESYRICYGAWFPDIPWKRDGRGEMRMLDEQVLDQADMQQPEEALKRLMRFAQGTIPIDPLTDDALSALLTLLVPDFTTVESPLSEVISADDTAITRLTDEQADRLMAMWQTHRQMAIPGHAGTGKTAIAMEMSWRLAQNGNRVLLLCANRTLAEHLRERLNASKRPYDARLLQILSLHELVNNIGIAGRVRHNEIRALGVNVSKEQDTLATIFTANLDVLEGRDKLPVYDALIVDEAQDINEPFWPALRRLLRQSDDSDEPAASNFYVFYDPAQRDLPGEWEPTWTGIAAINPPLTLNCRNSAGIYELMASLNPRLHDAPFRGPIGRPVLYRDPAAESAAMATTQANNPAFRIVDVETATLEQVLNELVEREAVRPEQILVVTCRSSDGRSKNQTRWRLREQQDIGRRSLEWLKARRSQIRISLATIRSSKGLESPVVVLAELDGIAGDARHDQLLYTAISRAKHQLIVLAPSDALQPKQPGWWEHFFKRSGEPKREHHSKRQQVTQRPADEPFIGPEDPDTPEGIGTPEATKPISSPAQERSSRSKTKSDPERAGADSDAPLQKASSTQGSVSGSGRVEFSRYQQAIFDFVRNGRGDGIVSAVAGSGKTFTLLQAARLLRTRSALFLAFNKHIAEELSKSLRGTPMSARTIHSIGYGSLMRYLGNDELEIVPHKYTKLSQAWMDDYRALLESEAKRQSTDWQDVPRVDFRRATDALDALVHFTRATLTDPSDDAQMRSMAAHFSVDLDAADANVSLDVLIQAVPQLLEEGGKIARGDGQEAGHVIDYMDMLYLPHVWHLPVRWHVDWVFVDEAQDLNAAQLALALKCRAQGGRMLFVGDRHQAIYGFSGADNNAFDYIKKTTQATEFPLSICYRCPTSHIVLAKELVPEIEAKPDAEVGVLANVEPAHLPKLVQKGDLMLCRKTVPLVNLCIKLMRHRIFARVKGRDIGARLTQVVQEITHLSGYTWARFGHFLKAYEDRQREKIGQFENAASELIALDDRIAAVRVCYEMFEAKDAAQLCLKIEEIFNDGQPDVLLSTVHRTKGLEVDRVFLLNPNEMPLIWPNQQGWELEQERNIKYVALTRARKELYRVDVPEAPR